MRSGRSWLAPLAITALLPASARGGDLDPPGALASTPGPEPRIAVNEANTPGDADALFVIDQPGSYYLAGNVSGEAFKHGIEVISPNVTLDLNGFILAGTPSAEDGVHIEMPDINIRAGVAVRNGSVRGWGGDGVDSDNATHVQIEALRLTENGGNGVFAGAVAQIRDCTADDNGEAGFKFGTGCTVVRCVAYVNRGDGFFNEFNTSVITDCTANINNGHGFSIGFATMVVNCTSQASRLSGVFVRNDGCSVIDCTVASSRQHGIEVTSDGCLIQGNTVNRSLNSADTAAGIHVAGTESRIEGNHVSFGDMGIEVMGTANLIIGNSATHNGNPAVPAADYVIGAGNDYGAIVVLSGGGSFTNSNPWANFSF